MDSYYRILVLEEGASLLLDGDRLTVDLDAATNCVEVTNDEEFQAAQSPGVYFWLSGGGTYLINDRYLLIVRRDSHSRVNGQMYSLFTGRADSHHEHQNPSSVIRELFEELLLFSGGRLYQPVYHPFQDLIALIYTVVRSRLGVNANSVLSLPLKLIGGFEKEVLVKKDGQLFRHYLNYHINKRRDINVLILFSAQVDIDGLSALDGENLRDPKEGTVPARDIFLYDLQTRIARQLTNRDTPMRCELSIDDHSMTEHLRYLVSLLRNSHAGNDHPCG